MINLTPHAITVIPDGAAVAHILPASGQEARVETREQDGALYMGAAITGIPDGDEPVLVSLPTAMALSDDEAATGRFHVVGPLVRDAQGRIIGTRRILRWGGRRPRWTRGDLLSAMWLAPRAVSVVLRQQIAPRLWLIVRREGVHGWAAEVHADTDGLSSAVLWTHTEGPRPESERVMGPHHRLVEAIDRGPYGSLVRSVYLRPLEEAVPARCECGAHIERAPGGEDAGFYCLNCG